MKSCKTCGSAKCACGPKKPSPVKPGKKMPPKGGKPPVAPKKPPFGGKK